MSEGVKPSGELEGKLANKILTHWKKEIDMIEALVYADSKQSGKSVYTLLTGYNVYSELLNDVSPMEIWDVVFKWFYTDLEEFCKDMLHFAKNVRLGNIDNKIPFVAYDDAGVGAGSDLYFKDRSTYFSLDKVLQTLGEVVNSFVMTSTAVDSPTGLLTDDRNVTVKITKNSTYGRTAHIFAKDTLPWGKSRDTKTFEDQFNVRLPQQIYDRYDVDRLDLTIECLEEAVSSFDDSFESLEVEKSEFTFS